MDYTDIGYNPLLTRNTTTNSITNVNSDALIASGAITYDQTSLRVIGGNQTIKSANFVGGQTGWIIRGDGSAEFQSLAASEFVKVYSQNEPPTGDLYKGDIWYDTNDDNKRYVYNGSNWVIDVSEANWSDVIDDDGNKPADNADVTADNPQSISWVTDAGALASKDQVDTAEIVDGAIEKVKMALLSVDEDIIAAGAITENKIYSGAVTTDKLNANAVTAAKIAAHTITASEMAADSITATEINVSLLSSISANIGTITAGSVTGITITGGTLQTSTATYPAVKITSGGIDIHGQSMSFKDTSGNLYGYVYGSGSFNIRASSTRNLALEAGSDIIFNPDGNDVRPNYDNDINLGTSSYTWKGFYAQTVNALDKITLTNYDVLDTYLTSVYLKGRGGSIQIQPTDGSTILQVESTKVFSPATSMTIELGDSSHYWEKTYTKDINVNNKISLNPLTSFPSGVQGDLCVRTDGKLYIYTGSAWTLVGSQT